MLKTLCCFVAKSLGMFRHLDFLALLAVRLYLVPIFWMAGTRKLNDMDNVIAWFRDGLHMPMPELMAYLATLTEVAGAVCLLLGIAVRLISIPLMIIMVVAAWTVHWIHGWYAIAPKGAESTQRLNGLFEWLQHYFPERYAYVTELGQPIMLNNGIEFAATFFIMLAVLLCYGGGRFLSVDYWVGRRYCK